MTEGDKISCNGFPSFWSNIISSSSHSQSHLLIKHWALHHYFSTWGIEPLQWSFKMTIRGWEMITDKDKIIIKKKQQHCKINLLNFLKFIDDSLIGRKKALQGNIRNTHEENNLALNMSWANSLLLVVWRVRTTPAKKRPKWHLHVRLPAVLRCCSWAAYLLSSR